MIEQMKRIASENIPRVGKEYTLLSFFRKII
jgi:hypothetical protein